MKTVKRIAALALCLVLVCSLTACYDEAELMDRLYAQEEKTRRLEEDLLELRERLEELLSRPVADDPIQSFVWYNTGFGEAIELDPVNCAAQVQFMISPAEKADAIKQAWDADKSAVKVNILHISENGESISGTAVLAIEEVTAADGILTLKVKEDAAAPLSAEFKSGDVYSVAYVTLKFGDTDMTSELIPIYVLLG